MGIYRIVNKVNNKIYVGSSTNIYERWKVHKNDLKENRHQNSHLQRAWNKYGEKNFKFEILEEIKADRNKIWAALIIRERYYVDFYDSLNRNKGYNLVYPSTFDCSQLTKEDVIKGCGNYSYEILSKIGELLETNISIKKIQETLNIPGHLVYDIYHRNKYQTFFKDYNFYNRETIYKKLEIYKNDILNRVKNGESYEQIAKDYDCYGVIINNFCQKNNVASVNKRTNTYIFDLSGNLLGTINTQKEADKYGINKGAVISSLGQGSGIIKSKYFVGKSKESFPNFNHIEDIVQNLSQRRVIPCACYLNGEIKGVFGTHNLFEYDIKSYFRTGYKDKNGLTWKRLKDLSHEEIQEIKKLKENNIIPVYNYKGEKINESREEIREKLLKFV